jgi:hypothetical protein
VRTIGSEEKSVGGIKFVKGALGYWRRDKYNNESYQGKFYRDLWRASISNETFEDCESRLFDEW